LNAIRDKINIGITVQIVQKQDQRTRKLTEGIVWELISPESTRFLSSLMNVAIISYAKSISFLARSTKNLDKVFASLFVRISPIESM